MIITVYGGGSWGTALAHVLASSPIKDRQVWLLLRDGAIADAINTRHENPRYLPGLALNTGVCAVTDPGVLRESDVWVLAVPCQAQRQALEEVRSLLKAETIIVNASKGIELSSLKPMSDVAAEALGENVANSTELSVLERPDMVPDRERGSAPQVSPPCQRYTPQVNCGDSDGAAEFRGRYAVLSGPSFARETVLNKPTAVVLGCPNEERGARLRDLFATPWFRCYSSLDIRGVELGGAVKNVVAIAAGVSDGLNFGYNARAALVTRGLAEITRLGLKLGARPSTFMGLSGLGDLMLTCTGDLSRNRQVGLRLGRGESLDQITADMRSVAEGVKTAAAVARLAREHDVEMPITAAMNAVLDGALTPLDAVRGLMSRALKEEK